MKIYTDAEKLNIKGDEAVVPPGPRRGAVRVPSSKSQLHRLLICAALSDCPAMIEYDGLSKDIEATAACLAGLGASIDMREEGLLRVSPIGTQQLPGKGFANTEAMHGRILPAGESGSTLRFLLPVAGALGASCAFRMEGRLPERPLAPFDDELRAHGMTIERSQGAEADPGGAVLLECSGQLQPGAYSLPGDISSQFVSGLLMALPLLGGNSTLRVTGRLESSAYVRITEDVLRLAGIRIEKNRQEYSIPGGQRPRLPERTEAESDWSSAAFFLCMGALSEGGVHVKDLRMGSHHADRAAADILERMGAAVTAENGGVTVRKGRLHGIDIDASGSPDLVPAIAALAAAAEGCTRIRGAARLRLKESDRIRTTAEMLSALGADVSETDDGLVINGRERLRGGCADAAADHRIAMAAAVAAGACEAPVIIKGSGCVAKSYPRFFRDLEGLEIENI